MPSKTHTTEPAQTRAPRSRNSGELTAADVLAVQRTAGNRAAQQFIAQRRVQAKLTVGPIDDPFEREADRMADAVLSSPLPNGEGTRVGDGNVQREATPEDDELQTKPLAGQITPLAQREAMPEEDEEVQRQAEEEDEIAQTKREVNPTPSPSPMGRGERVQRKGDGSFDAGADVEQRITRSKGAGSPLPDATRGEMEGKFGADFSGVRVHAGSEAAQLNQDLSAQAFTHGSDVYFGEGKFAPASSEGKHLLAHELTHVVQQKPSVSRQPKEKKLLQITDEISTDYKELSSRVQSLVSLQHFASFRFDLLGKFGSIEGINRYYESLVPASFLGTQYEPTLIHPNLQAKLIRAEMLLNNTKTARASNEVEETWTELVKRKGRVNLSPTKIRPNQSDKSKPSDHSYGWAIDINSAVNPYVLKPSIKSFRQLVKENTNLDLDAIAKSKRFTKGGSSQELLPHIEKIRHSSESLVESLSNPANLLADHNQGLFSKIKTKDDIDISKTGFMNLSPELVAALTGSDGGGLVWLGPSTSVNDFHHFELKEGDHPSLQNTQIDDSLMNQTHEQH